MTIKTRSEKRSEDELNELLKSENFDNKCIFYSPNENNTLKDLFKESSKSGDKHGIPDRLYFDNKTLIIFECKATSLNKAIKDIEHYIKNLKDCDYTIYGVAFVNNTNYKIINLENKTICLETFKLVKNNILINQDTMNYKIHEIHNHIRDYTKISNEDKPFFIACILIALKNKQFINVIENLTKDKDDIYTIIKQVLKQVDIDISIFEFLETSLDNKHFYTIIKMVLDIYSQNPSTDLLNLFYHEFVKYSNTDSKSLGIVLTPDHIVKLMVQLLDVKKDDIILDLCTGTGSFLLEALKYKPKNIIGCEFQTKLFNLFKCNLILRDIKNYNIIKNDCFEEKFKATKSIINPPYGTKGKKELDFVLKQLQSIPEGGLAISIIPNTKLNNKIIREKILKISKIKKIIYCNPDLFKPVASIETLIILLEKNTIEGHIFEKDYVSIIDYTDDGIENVLKKGRLANITFEEKYSMVINNKNTKLLNENESWWYKNKKLVFKFNKNIKKMREEQRIYEAKIKKLELTNDYIKFSNVKSFKISDIFNIITCSRTTLSYVKNNPGKYPYISASDKNNGITGYTNKYTNDGTYLSIANSGSVCSTFLHKGKICGTDSIYLLVLKDPNIILEDIAEYFIQYFYNLKQKYNFYNAFRLDKIKNEIIELPIDKNNNIDFKLIAYEINN